MSTNGAITWIKPPTEVTIDNRAEKEPKDHYGFCAIENCGHQRTSHVRNVNGTRGRCEYGRCPCRAYMVIQ